MKLDSALETLIRDFSAGSFDSRLRIDSGLSDEEKTAASVNRLLDLVSGALSRQSRDLAVAQEQNAGTDAFLSSVSAVISSLSQGNFTPSLPAAPLDSRPGGGPGAVVRSLEDLIHSLRNLEEGLSRIAGDISAGKTGSRFDSSGFSGGLQESIVWMNRALDSISSPLAESVRVAERFAAYDFETRFDPAIPVPGEWGPLREAFETIGIQIHDAFASINSQVSELSAHAGQANISVQEVADTSEQVARNSDAVSQNTEQSDAGVRQVLRAMEDLSVTVGEVSQKAESVSRITQESTNLSREGTESAKKAEEGMMVITRSAEDMDRLIGEIQQEMKKINEIVRLITDIANQTNLLALNAAIEAARAGEMGRGFAVVASEVKALALESRASAEKITGMISNLQKHSQKAADAVSVATHAVTDGNTMLSDTLRVFGRLAMAVEDISMNIEQVASMNEEQAAAVEEITSSMHEVSAMLKDTAREAMDSARATGDTSASVSQLRIIVDQVAGISEKVSASMSRFRF